MYQRLLYNFTFQPREVKKRDQNQEAFEANVQVIIGCGWVGCILYIQHTGTHCHAHDIATNFTDGSSYTY